MVSKEFAFKAELRKSTGSKDSAMLRAQNKIPAVIYGHKQEPEHIALKLHDFTMALHHGHRLFDIEFGGKSEKLLIKDVQYDYLGKNIIHADLIRVDLSEKVKVEVSLVFKGTAAGASEGGLLEEHLTSVEIECAVTDIPKTIDVSVKNLKIGDSIHAGDVELPIGATLVTESSALLIACHPPIVVAETAEVEEGEEATSPEVITERKDEEEGSK